MTGEALAAALLSAGRRTQMDRAFGVVVAGGLVLFGVWGAAEASGAGPAVGAPGQTRWIWFPEDSPPAGDRQFRKSVAIPPGAKVKLAGLFVTADDSCTVCLNGRQVAAKTSSWELIEKLDVTKHLAPGRNVLAVEVRNAGASAGLLAWLVVRLEQGPPLVVVTDGTWKASNVNELGWEHPDFDDLAWPKAKALGPAATAPWGERLRRLGSSLTLAARRSGSKPLTPEEAKALIEADWVFQAGDFPGPALSLAEIARARKLAKRLAGHSKRPSFQAELAELARLEARLRVLSPPEEAGADSAPGHVELRRQMESKVQALLLDTNDDEVRGLYLAVRRVKRRIAFKNPVLDFDRVLLADSPTYAAGGHESAHRNGYNYGANASGRLIVLEGLRPDGTECDLLPEGGGMVMRLDLSFDADKVVYSMKPLAQRSFHLYEVSIDGSGHRQLTNSPYDDMDPIYLPDGRILFSTSRGNTYVRCLPDSASTVLARCDADGGNIRIISRNSEPDYTPAVMPDGRVLYTRWEYTERPLWRLQKLWTINPDGTGEAVYWGNGSVYPDLLWEARPIPGTNRVIFAGVGHHNCITGCVGILDVNRGREWPDGIWKVTADLPWPEVHGPKGGEPVASPDYHAAGTFWSYRCPHPLGPEDFLVSAAKAGGGRQRGRFDLYLMDIHGNRELIYSGLQNVWYAQPVRRRPRPPALADRVAWPAPGEEPQVGVLFSPNVYYGVDGLPAGQARYLRVIQMDAKTYSMGFKSYRHSGPVISILQEDGVKRILGTVPIEADGSVAFRAPAGKALHVQLLDAHRRCLQVMRSFTGVMPGESRGCLGCHALHSVSPETRPNALALRRPPAELTPPPWGADVSISYERFCQPVLDKHCGKCHQGEGKARAKLDLTLRGGLAERGVEDPRLLPFKQPYLTLVGPTAWARVPGLGPKTPGYGLAGALPVESRQRYGPVSPMTTLSYTSPLIARAMSGKHHKVKIEGEDLLRLIAWVDCNCVYRGDEEVREIPDPAPAVAARFPVPVRTRTAPRIRRLQPVTDPPPGR